MVLQVATVKQVISIHALREEGDATGTRGAASATDFYPRPPRGGRRDAKAKDIAGGEISIHALREEGDGRAGKQV